MQWSEEAVAAELDGMAMYGRKSSVWGVTERACINRGPDFLRSPCAWGMCKCPVVGFGYAWECWCTDGHVSYDWRAAISELEYHMWCGSHK